MAMRRSTVFVTSLATASGVNPSPSTLNFSSSTSFLWSSSSRLSLATITRFSPSSPTGPLRRSESSFGSVLSSPSPLSLWRSVPSPSPASQTSSCCSSSSPVCLASDPLQHQILVPETRHRSFASAGSRPPTPTSSSSSSSSSSSHRPGLPTPKARPHKETPYRRSVLARRLAVIAEKRAAQLAEDKKNNVRLTKREPKKKKEPAVATEKKEEGKKEEPPAPTPEDTVKVKRFLAEIKQSDLIEKLGTLSWDDLLATKSRKFRSLGLSVIQRKLVLAHAEHHRQLAALLARIPPDTRAEIEANEWQVLPPGRTKKQKLTPNKEGADGTTKEVATQ